MAWINMKGLQKEISKQYSMGFRKQMERKIRQDVKQAQTKMVLAFESHDVTRDLDRGPSGSSLPGGGDLFSFIGFESGDRPTNALRALLTRGIKVQFISSLKNDIEATFQIDIPTKEQIEELTPMPWAPGRSWAREIEMGIPGLGQYLVTDSSASRSGKAIQVKSVIRSGQFGAKSYMTKILSTFIADLTKTISK